MINSLIANSDSGLIFNIEIISSRIINLLDNDNPIIASDTESTIVGYFEPGDEIMPLSD